MKVSVEFTIEVTDERRDAIGGGCDEPERRATREEVRTYFKESENQWAGGGSRPGARLRGPGPAGRRRSVGCRQPRLLALALLG